MIIHTNKQAELTTLYIDYIGLVQICLVLVSLAYDTPQSKGINPLTKYLTDWVRHKSHKNL